MLPASPSSLSRLFLLDPNSTPTTPTSKPTQPLNLLLTTPTFHYSQTPYITFKYPHTHNTTFLFSASQLHTQTRGNTQHNHLLLFLKCLASLLSFFKSPTLFQSSLLNQHHPKHTHHRETHYFVTHFTPSYSSSSSQLLPYTPTCYFFLFHIFLLIHTILTSFSYQHSTYTASTHPFNYIPAILHDPNYTPAHNHHQFTIQHKQVQSTYVGINHKYTTQHYGQGYNCLKIKHEHTELITTQLNTIYQNRNYQLGNNQRTSKQPIIKPLVPNYLLTADYNSTHLTSHHKVDSNDRNKQKR